MNFSTILTFHAVAGLSLFSILISSALLPTEAKVNHGAYLPGVSDSDDLNKILSPEMCYNGTNGIADSCRWPGGIFIYDINDELFSSHQLKVLGEAHKQISEATGQCITFRRKAANDTTYILITKDSLCTSPVGRRIGQTEMSLTDICFGRPIPTSWVTMVHLLSLGLWVEHGREDRDQYVEVHEENIYEDFLPFFKKINGTTYSTPYDYDSLLHFAQFAYTKNGYSTIVPRDMSVTTGRGTYMSKLDVMKLRNLYSCN